MAASDVASNTAVEKNDFGSLVRQLRLAQNLRQDELAARSHFAQSYISRLERGLRRPSLPRHVHSLAAGLGVADAEADALYRAAGFLPISDAGIASDDRVAEEADTLSEPPAEEPRWLAEEFIAGRAVRESPSLSERGGDLPSRRSTIHDRETASRAAISLVNEVPPRRLAVHGGSAIACTIESAEFFARMPGLRSEWHAALHTALARRWDIHHLVRLDRGAESAFG